MDNEAWMQIMIYYDTYWIPRKISGCWRDEVFFDIPDYDDTNNALEGSWSNMDKIIFGNKCTTFTVDAVSKVTGFRPDGQSMPQLGLFEAALKAHEDRVEGWAADGWPLPCIVLGGVCFVIALLSVLDGLKLHVKLPVFIFPKQSAICSGLATVLAQCFDIIGRLRRAGARVA